MCAQVGCPESNSFYKIYDNVTGVTGLKGQESVVLSFGTSSQMYEWCRECLPYQPYTLLLGKNILGFRCDWHDWI